MRKTVCLLFVIFLLLCGCSQKEKSDLPINPVVGNFSYEEVLNYYKDTDEPGIKRSGFVNVEKTEVNNADQAAELAIKECKVEYDTISVAFDAASTMYMVSFGKTDNDGGNQDVYIDREGITQLIIYGE